MHYFLTTRSVESEALSAVAQISTTWNIAFVALAVLVAILALGVTAALYFFRKRDSDDVRGLIKARGAKLLSELAKDEDFVEKIARIVISSEMFRKRLEERITTISERNNGVESDPELAELSRQVSEKGK